MTRDLRAYVTDDLPDDQVAALEAEPEVLLKDLIGLSQSVSDGIARRKVEASEFHNECLRAGHNRKQTWFDYKTEWTRWRAREVTFKHAVDDKIRHVRSLLRTEHVTASHLRHAIREHQRMVAETGEVSDVDRALWQAAGLQTEVPA